MNRETEALGDSASSHSSGREEDGGSTGGSYSDEKWAPGRVSGGECASSPYSPLGRTPQNQFKSVVVEKRE